MKTYTVPIYLNCPNCGHETPAGDGNRAICRHCETPTLLIGTNSGKPVKADNPDQGVITFEDVLEDMERGGCRSGNCNL